MVLLPDQAIRSWCGLHRPGALRLVAGNSVGSKETNDSVLKNPGMAH
jgi:hypothetical protein